MADKPSMNRLLGQFRWNAVAVALSLVCCGVAIAEDQATPFAAMSFDQACVAAKDQNRLVLVYFSKLGDEQCETFRKLTWHDASVGKWLGEHVIAIEVEASSGQALRARFSVLATPTVLVLSSGGDLRSRIVGFRDAAELLVELDAALQASDPVELARRRLELSADNAAAMLAYARALEEHGKFDAALKQYQLCLERESKRGSQFGGMTLVVLDELSRLGKRFPAAHEALLQIRNASRERLLTGKGSQTDPSVLTASNINLKDANDTFTVFKKLESSAPNDLTTRLFRECAVDAMLAIGDYDRAGKLIDASVYARHAYRQYQYDISKPVPLGADYGEFRSFQGRTYVDRSVKYYEILLGIDQPQDANEIASTLLRVDDGPDTLIAMARAGLRSNHPTEVHAHYVRQALRSYDHPHAELLSLFVKLLIQLDHCDEATEVVDEYGPALDDDAAFESLNALLAG